MRGFIVVVSLILLGLCAGCPAATDDDNTPVGDDDDTSDDDTSDDDTSDDDAGDDDTLHEIQQPPITFRITNSTPDPLHVDWLEWWSDDINAILSCASQVGDSWENCLFGLPFDADECTPQNLGVDCSGGIDSGPAVYLLPPGKSLDVLWPGKLWDGDPDHCSTGVCFAEGPTYEGHYGATTVLWTEMGCLQGECPDPGPDGGVIQGAYVTGEHASHHVEFDLPFAEDVLPFPIEEPGR